MDDEIVKQAKKKAIDENKSFSAMVEKFLKEYLDRQEAVESWNRRNGNGEKTVKRIP